VAKKSTTTRVFQLAKELGVASKDVVAKCQAEEIPGITNHMSTVSLGLAQTIREWFDTGGGGTAVETAAPVDLEQARSRIRTKTARKAAKKASRKTTGVAEIDAPAPVEVTAAPPEIEPAIVAPVAPAISDFPPSVVEEAPVEAPPAEMPTDMPTEMPTEMPAVTPAAEEPAVEAPEAETDEAGITDKPQPVMNVPDRPDVIAPAGPKLERPGRVKLAGPKVIRVESPDVVPRPRSRPPRAGGPGTGTGAGVRPGVSRGAPGEGPAMPARGGRGTSRRNKRRSATAREEQARPGRLTPAAESQRPFNWREQDLREREMRLTRAGGFFKAARRDNLKRSTGGGHRAVAAVQGGGMVKVAEPITVKDLSAATGVKATEILKKLLLAGTPATVNATIPTETAVEIMLEYEIELDITEQKTAEERIVEQFEQREVADERPRCPVVTILGHVDHGKTSLLDQIRHTNVAAGEAGGITQATSAFQVPVKLSDSERVITFIDTPGHEAFTEMRSRGAKVTDLVVLVVAADDGVMPQTIESINHARAAGVPIVVALNKIDKPEATDPNIQRILGELAEHELNPVEWGGSTEVVRTSAIKSEGIQDLLDVLDFQAQLLEMKADFGGRAEGTVLESQMEEGRGPVVNLLVQQGLLQRGEFVVVGRAFGRVRDLVNDRGQRIDSAGPSMPVTLSGINEVPDAGDKFYVVGSLKEAEAAADERRSEERSRGLTRERVTLDNIFQKISESKRKELPLIVKGDVQGAVDTLKTTLERISTEEVTIAIKHAQVGGINDSDILLAEAAGAIIVGFNVTASGKARKQAEAKGVDIRLYDVIYDVIDEVKKAAEGLLEPEYKLEVLGHAEVRQVFKISKVGMIAGCYVTDGVVERNAQIRVTRESIVVEKDRRLEQLKRVKDDAKEVRAGQECGMKIDGYDDIKVGDVLECYKTREVRRTL
jgi:translation initiation factor IF-2